MKYRSILTLLLISWLSLDLMAFQLSLPECTSYFTWEPLAGADKAIKFTNESSGDFNSWSWDFGDGITSSVFHPEHIYSDFGTYVVCLTVSDGAGCTDVYCDTVEVTPICNADFEFSYVPTTPIHVQFTDLSTGYPNSWFWDFGDGNTSYQQNPVHPYPEPGNYEVRLIIEHEDMQYSCKDTVYKTVVIPDSVNCEAMFTYDISGDYPLEVHFTDHSSGDITNWEWDFGDGSTSVEQHPVHLFPGPGEFLVCLKVYNADSIGSCFHFICETIVLPDSMVCESNFIASADSSSNVLNKYTFTDQSDGYPDHWLWDFGDGNTSYGQNPEHTYAQAGTYMVCLTSWNSVFSGCEDTYCRTLQTPEYHKLGGQAFIGPNPINNPYPTGDTGIAVLYRQRPNKQLIAIDTSIFHEHGYYWFNNKMEQPYVLRISLSNGSEHYQDVIPTYYPSSMSWTNAQAVQLDQDIFNVHTSLIEIESAQQGVARIRGHIIFENTMESLSIFETGRIPVFLVNEPGQVVAWTSSSNEGSFVFNNIAYGSYMVYADLAGMYSQAVPVKLDENTPAIDTLEVNMYENSPMGVPDPEAEAFSLSMLYPNPAIDRIHLIVQAETASDATIIIYSSLGQEVFRGDARLSKGENKLEYSIDQLPENMYFLRLQAEKQKPLMSTFIKVD